jgi:hypothetical protein
MPSILESEIKKETRLQQKSRLITLLTEYGTFPEEQKASSEFLELTARIRFHLSAEDLVLDEALRYLLVYASSQVGEVARALIFSFACKPALLPTNKAPALASLVAIPVCHEGLSLKGLPPEKLMARLVASLQSSGLLARGASLKPAPAPVSLAELASLPLHSVRNLSECIVLGKPLPLGGASAMERWGDSLQMLQESTSILLFVALQSPEKEGLALEGLEPTEQITDSTLELQVEWSTKASLDLDALLGITDGDESGGVTVLRPLSLFEAILEAAEVAMELEVSGELISELQEWQEQGAKNIDVTLQVSHMKSETKGLLRVEGDGGRKVFCPVPLAPFQSINELEGTLTAIATEVVEALAGVPSGGSSELQEAQEEVQELFRPSGKLLH